MVGGVTNLQPTKKPTNSLLHRPVNSKPFTLLLLACIWQPTFQDHSISPSLLVVTLQPLRNIFFFHSASSHAQIDRYIYKKSPAPILNREVFDIKKEVRSNQNLYLSTTCPNQINNQIKHQNAKRTRNKLTGKHVQHPRWDQRCRNGILSLQQYERVLLLRQLQWVNVLRQPQWVSNLYRSLRRKKVGNWIGEHRYTTTFSLFPSPRRVICPSIGTYPHPPRLPIS